MGGVRVVTGDDISINVTITKKNASFAISDNAVVKAALIYATTGEKLTGDILQSKDTPGADFANSLVVVKIPSTETINIDKSGTVNVEIQVDEALTSGKETFLGPVQMVQGKIA